MHNPSDTVIRGSIEEGATTSAAGLYEGERTPNPYFGMERSQWAREELDERTTSKERQGIGLHYFVIRRERLTNLGSLSELHYPRSGLSDGW